MILILGGTTEGRIAVETLEEAGKPFFYSTKGNEQDVALHRGTRLTGGLDATGMLDFCRSQNIRLLVDAAHPFAEVLHHTVDHVATVLHLPVIRLERIYPTVPAEGVVWCADYADAVQRMQQAGIQSLLGLTGVQTIASLRRFWKNQDNCYFRILDRDSSRALALQAGFPLERLCYYQGEGNDRALMERLHPDAIVVKESGTSGGFSEKVEAAVALGIRVFVIRRPVLPAAFQVVNGPHGLRRCIQQILPDFYELHSGLTTGTTATAACVAAVQHFLGETADSVTVVLPNGESLAVQVAAYDDAHSATVCKDAGDDPDITNGTPICAKVLYQQTDAASSVSVYQLRVEGGQGVGRVTLPGLGLPVGGPAINETPRRMIETNLQRVLRDRQAPSGRYTLVVSIPEGEALAARTFNPRLGIVGGLSIIGTSGIVKPFSSEAFVASIRQSMKVACATGSPCIVINSGAKSERFLQVRFPDLPAQAFVHYGNFIGETLRIAAELNVSHLILGLMMGKAVKLAEGHLDTHSKHTVMNKVFLQQVAAEAGCSQLTQQVINRLTLARELWQLLPPFDLRLFVCALVQRCYDHCVPLLPKGKLTVLLLAEDGIVYDVLEEN